MNMQPAAIQADTTSAGVISDLQRMIVQPGSKPRDVIQQARTELGDVLFSAQYVYDPRSSTGVYLQLHFRPEIHRDSILFEVKEEWVHWQA